MAHYIVLGTRPEIIKLAPVIREYQKRGIDFKILHTNQHYTYEMDRLFFKELNLPEPDINLNVGSGTQGEQSGKMLIRIEKKVLEDKPGLIIVQGDTNTVMAGALVGVKLHIHVAHVEAGLRSFDRTMPEEINRIVADHSSDILLAPTEVAKQNLLAEGISRDFIHVTGNTIVDATLQHLKYIDKSVMDRLGLKEGEYFLSTFHRAENVDNRDRLTSILGGLKAAADRYEIPVVVPMHPRTEKMIEHFGLHLPDNMLVTDPVGYLEFLALEKWARAILTDSGGLQEEASILRVPCVTLRDNTERPETVDSGANIVAGVKKDSIISALADILTRHMPEKNPYGDGTASRKILDIIEEKVI